MKLKTSVTLSSALPEKTDRVDTNRSASPERNPRDAEILDRNAERLNEEAVDVLEYQGLPESMRPICSWRSRPVEGSRVKRVRKNSASSPL
jgi:hypothetical protein